jgi:hypothetical protein
MGKGKVMKQLDPKWIRVSSILSMIPSIDNEGKWGYPLQNIDQQILQKKADLGSSIHSAISSHVKGEFMPISKKEEGYFNSYLMWEKSLGIKPLFTEIRLFHEPMKLTGCLDMITLIGSSEKRYIVDFKCTLSPDSIKWPIQGALYELLSELNKIEVEKTCFFVQLDQNGNPPKVYEYEITKQLTSMAIAFYNSYRYLTKK